MRLPKRFRKGRRGNGKQRTGRPLKGLCLMGMASAMVSCAALPPCSDTAGDETVPPIHYMAKRRDFTCQPGPRLSGDRESTDLPDGEAEGEFPWSFPRIDPSITSTLDRVVDELKFYSAYALKLGVPLEGTENKSLILAVEEWMGTRYRWGGCSKLGVDCSCLVKSIYEQVYGIELRRTSIGMYYEDLTPVDRRELREGDILCFKIRRNRISHVGLYLTGDKFVHASLSRGVMINDLNDPYYKKRFFAAGRVTERMRLSLSTPSVQWEHNR